MTLRRLPLVIVTLLLPSCASIENDEPIAYRDPPPGLYRPLHRRPTPQSGMVQPANRQIPRPATADAWPPNSGRISKRWSTIVIHHSATDRGGAQAFDRFHRGKGWDELGYHFVIGNGSETPDGFVEVGSRWHKQKHGAHCKTADQYFNQHGIGICLVGDFTQQRPTPRQMQSLSRLVNYLSYVCNIPPERVTTHGLVNPETQCPGPMFSLGAVRARIGGHATASSLGR